MDNLENDLESIIGSLRNLLSPTVAEFLTLMFNKSGKSRQPQGLILNIKINGFIYKINQFFLSVVII